MYILNFFKKDFFWQPADSAAMHQNM